MPPGQDVLAMIAFGLLLSLVFGAVVCGGLGSIAKQKNVQVVGIIKIKLLDKTYRTFAWMCSAHRGKSTISFIQQLDLKNSHNLNILLLCN